MSAEIVPFRPPKAKPKPDPTRQELVARLRKLAEDTGNMHMDAPHLKQRMAQRGKTMRQILETVRKGECVSGPTKDQWGDWRLKLRRCVAGQRVQVVVAVKDRHFVVVTVI